jgi:hypothetical protein
VEGARRHVVRLALEDRHGLGQGSAAPPLLRHPRVAGRGQRPLAEVRADVDPVLVDPADAALRLRQLEPAVDERQRRQVELTHDGRVGATPRQLDEGAPVPGAQHGRALPHPVLAVGLAKRVDVENDLPAGVVGAVPLQRGAPPQTTRVRGVLPEVVQVLATPARVRDAVVGVQHLADLVPQCGEPVAGQLGGGRRVVLPHPVQGGLVGDLF